LIIAAASLVPRTLFRTSDEAPPAPSRVVRFEPGVDWHAEGGR
jgi:hypothetical protein